MNATLRTACSMALLGITAAAVAADQPTPSTVKQANPNLGRLRHVVMFKFKPDTTPEQVKAIEDAFRALPAKVPQIVDFEWGTDVSVENRSQGFTHCFVVTFKDAAGRDVYLPHPAHKEFGKVLGTHIAKVLVFDFWAKE